MNMKKLPCFLSLLLVLMLVGSQAAARADSPKSGAEAPRKAKKAEAPAFAFTLSDQDGKPVSLKDHAGKIVVLEWINWGCPFDRRHHAAGTMKKLAGKYTPKGVVWLGIDSTKSHGVAAIKKWHTQQKLPFAVLDDHAGVVGRMFGARTTPHMIVLNKKHEVAYDGAIDDDPGGRKLEGGTALNYVDQALGELLAGKAVSVPKTKSYGCGVKYAPTPKTAKAPDFTLRDHNGKEVSLSALAGKTVVLEWTNPGCPVVRRHYAAKTMVTLADKYRDKGVVWLAVNTTAGANHARNKAFAEQHKLPYAILDDHEGTVGRKYGARTTPHMFIVDRKGHLVYGGAIDDDPGGRKLGQGKAKNHVDAILAQLVAGKAVAPTQTKPYGCGVKYARK